MQPGLNLYRIRKRIKSFTNRVSDLSSMWYPVDSMSNCDDYKNVTLRVFLDKPSSLIA